MLISYKVVCVVWKTDACFTAANNREKIEETKKQVGMVLLVSPKVGLGNNYAYCLQCCPTSQEDKLIQQN